MAWKIQQYLTQWPSTRVLVLAHVRELLTQGVEKMRAIWPAAPIGIYSAGLGRKDANYSITYASIQSIHRKASKFPPFDLIFVDEAHRIPLAGETTYRKFLAEAKEWARLHGKPHTRVIGWTATPYRLDGGPICGPDHILNDICYEANVADLIAQGYLCKLTSKAGERVADVSKVHIKKGEYDTAELMAIMGDEELVRGAVAETLDRAKDRNAIIFFCVNVQHAHQVSRELSAKQFDAPVVSAETPKDERDRTIRRFTAGELRGVCNVNVLSEGFDAQRIDCVVLLRPTASPGLFYQQVGRGLRLHPTKTNCLVLDFSGNTQRHGPIDALGMDSKTAGDGTGEPPGKECPECAEIIAAGCLKCPQCGYEFPPRAVKHETKAAALPILSEPEIFTPADVAVEIRQRDGKPKTLRVMYHDGGARMVSEFLCFEHMGYAAKKARDWWRIRFGEPTPNTAEEAASDMHLPAAILEQTESLTIRRNGKYYDVIAAKIRNPNKVRAL
jgi:DNA repair protein RadD